MRTPLWEKIYRSLVEDIQRGRYPVGSVLPTESEIIDTFGVSRHTARRAYAELVRLGYVRRTPHVGSQVINTGHLPNFYYEVESFSNLDPYHNLQPREILAQSHFVYAPGEEEDLPFAENEPVWRIDFARFGRQPYEVLGLTTAPKTNAFSTPSAPSPRCPSSIFSAGFATTPARRSISRCAQKS